MVVDTFSNEPVMSMPAKASTCFDQLAIERNWGVWTTCWIAESILESLFTLAETFPLDKGHVTPLSE